MWFVLIAVVVVLIGVAVAMSAPKGRRTRYRTVEEREPGET